MSDFEVMPIGTAAKIAELEAALREAEPLVETLHSIMTAKDTRTTVWRCLKRIRDALPQQTRKAA